MRTYGRDSTGAWQVVQTNPANGDNSMVWVTTVIQNLLLNRNESPFYAAYGVPAQQDALAQLYPDLAIAQLQNQFSKYFASLIISKLPATYPAYAVNIITLQGATVSATISY